MASTKPINFTHATITAADDGGNSESLVLFDGTCTVGNVRPDGREDSVYQRQGYTSGHQQTGRAYPTLSFVGQLHQPFADFHALLLGKTSGYVSCSASIGDGKSVNVTVDASTGADTRTVYAGRCRLTDMPMDFGGDPATVSFEMECTGIFKLDGTEIVSTP